MSDTRIVYASQHAVHATHCFSWGSDGRIVASLKGTARKKTPPRHATCYYCQRLNQSTVSLTTQNQHFTNHPRANDNIHSHSAAFAHIAFSGAVVTNRAAVQPRRQQANPHTRTLTCAAIQPHVAPVCRLNSLRLRKYRNPCT